MYVCVGLCVVTARDNTWLKDSGLKIPSFVVFFGGVGENGFHQ